LVDKRGAAKFQNSTELGEKMETNCIVVFVTAVNEKEAQTIAQSLLEKRLAACVNIIPGLKSIFLWQGNMEKAEEFLLIAKTTTETFEELRKEIKKLHSYTVPEIIALPIIAGSTEYLEWIRNEVKQHT
jgi:periplasmic divalent cation tolerance protein